MRSAREECHSTFFRSGKSGLIAFSCVASRMEKCEINTHEIDLKRESGFARMEMHGCTYVDVATSENGGNIRHSLSPGVKLINVYLLIVQPSHFHTNYSRTNGECTPLDGCICSVPASLPLEFRVCTLFARFSPKWLDAFPISMEPFYLVHSSSRM